MLPGVNTLTPAQRGLIGLLVGLWLGLTGLELALLPRNEKPALQDEVELQLKARAARIVRSSTALNAREREILSRAFELQPEAGGSSPDQREAADCDLTMLVAGSCWLLTNLLAGPIVLLWWLARGRKLATPPPEKPTPWQAWLVFVSWQLGALVLVPFIVSLGGGPRAQILVVGAQLVAYGLGLRFILPLVGPFRPSLRGLAQGLAAFWAAAFGVMAIGWLVQALTGHPLVSRNNALDLFRDASPADMAALGFLVVLAGPFFEEYLFRGLLFGGLRRNGEWAATLLSALVFALAHRDPAGFLPYMWIAIVFARTYAMTGSLFPSMVAHALFNGQTFALLFALSAG